MDIGEKIISISIAIIIVIYLCTLPYCAIKRENLEHEFRMKKLEKGCGP